jgi:hypothetical protein
MRRIKDKLILKGGKLFSKTFKLIRRSHYNILNFIYKIDKNIPISFSTKMIPLNNVEYPKWEGESEVQINENITLKLENYLTTIYVNGQRFSQCKYLLIDIPDIALGEEIDSIDKAEAKLSRALEGRMDIISPQEEFWGHASNIQAWAENDYDSRILHRTIAFPLLKKLADLGDNRALIRFQEEIIKRIKEDYLTVTKYIVQEGYLAYIDEDQYDLIRDNSVLESAMIDIEDLSILVNSSDPHTFARIESDLIDRFEDTRETQQMREDLRKYLLFLTEKAFNKIKMIPLFNEVLSSDMYSLSELYNQEIPPYIKGHLSNLIYDLALYSNLRDSKSFLSYNLYRALGNQQYDIIMNTPNLHKALFSSTFYLRKLSNIPDERAMEELRNYIMDEIRKNNETKIKELVLENFLQYLSKEQLSESYKNEIVMKYIEAIGTWKKEFEIEEDVKILTIREDNEGIFYIETNNNREYYIAEDLECAISYAKEGIESDLEHQPEIFNKSFLESHIDRDRLVKIMKDDFDEVAYDELEIYFDEDEIIEALKIKLKEDEDPSSIWDRDLSNIYDKLQNTQLYKQKRKDYAHDRVDNELQTYFGKDVYKNYLNLEEAVEDAINTDGWEHFVGSYDGTSNELNNGMVYWRHN